MKLKKIAALALAGVMAVSMLAGCGTDKKPGSGEGEGEGTVTTTGYSATLKDQLDLDAKKYDYITFADNAADETALKDALSYLGASAIESYATWNVGLVPTASGTNSTMLNNLLKKSLKTTDWGTGDLEFYVNNNVNSDGVRAYVLYATNGVADDNSVVKQVADQVKAKIQAFEDENTSTTVKAEYTYTVSVSLAHKTVGDSDATFVLVTATRDSSAN